MSGTSCGVEAEAITRLIRRDLDGARRGRGDAIKPALPEDARLVGQIGDDLIAAPIAALLAWNDTNGPARELKVCSASIDVGGPAPTFAGTWTAGLGTASGTSSIS